MPQTELMARELSWESTAIASMLRMTRPTWLVAPGNRIRTGTHS